MDAKHILVEYLENQLPSWSNAHGVQLYLNTDSSLILVADYPGIVQPPDVNIELTRLFKSQNNFLRAMELSHLEQLQQLKPLDLLARYELGQVNILCSMATNIYWELSFKKKNGNIWARDLNEKLHKVKVRLGSPEDYIAYAVGYYKVTHNNDQINVNS